MRLRLGTVVVCLACIPTSARADDAPSDVADSKAQIPAKDGTTHALHPESAPSSLDDAASQGPLPLEERAMLGAVGPDGGAFVAHANVGIAFLLPQASAALRVGTGYGGSVEARYKNIAFFGHEGQLRLGWGAPVTDSLDIGIAYRTSLTSLAAADGGVIGIDFSNFALGNDWEMGNDLLLTWNRGERAHVTVSAGPHFSLGGTRFSNSRDSEFEFEPSFRAIATAVQGEWQLNADLHVVLRLDANILVGTETVPLGFLPLGTLGLAYEI